jgi:hemerythrin superfamily protein
MDLMSTATLNDVKTTLTEQHTLIKEMMIAVQDGRGLERKDAFARLCAFLAAHEAAEEECIHAAAKEDLTGSDAQIVDERTAEEEEAGQVIAELEQLGTDSDQFAEKFDQLAQAVIAHAEAEEHEELPKLEGKADEAQFGRMRDALARVPQIASQASGGSFKDQLGAARAEYRSDAI